MIKHLHLDQNGIEMLIGPLEAEILRVLWATRDPLTANQILNTMIRGGRDIALSTLHTTLTRMATKQLVRNFKRKPNTSTLWEATTEDEDFFVLECFDKVFARIYAEYPDLTVNIMQKGNG